jgi:flagellar biosynthesis/type III secretory pathway protein FliH
MTRLLSSPVIADAAHRIAPPTPVLDDATRDLLARVEAEAYARGRVDGQQEAADAAAATADRVAGAVGHALSEVRGLIAALEDQRRVSTLDLARRIATAVLGTEPQGDGRALLERIDQAVAALDHGPFVVAVSPADHEVVAAAGLDVPSGSEITADPTLRPGEARITGPWSRADLTHATVVDIVAPLLATADMGAPGLPHAVHPGARQ